MATKIQVVNIKHPRIKLLEKKNQVEKEKKKLSNFLVWILVFLLIILLLELIILFV
jgi:hypothetical protein